MGPGFQALPEYGQHAFREQRESLHSFEEMIKNLRASVREMRHKAILLAYGIQEGSRLKNLRYPGNRIFQVLPDDNNTDGSVGLRWTGEGDPDPETGKPKPPALHRMSLGYESIFSDNFGTRWEVIEK